jgi:hypothetical protein
MASVTEQKLKPQSSTDALLFALMAIGALTLAYGLYSNAERTWHSYLVNHSLFMGLGIGGLFFLVIHYLASAGWNVALRRVSESFASYLFVAVIFHVAIFFGLKHLYPWTDLGYVRSEHLVYHKETYFSLPFYAARTALFWAVVLFFAWKLISNSTRQDQEGGVELTQKQKPLSALFLVLFAPMFTVFSVDLVKSLDPRWFSTMFGVYIFVGFVQASIAASIVAITLMQKRGYLLEITEDHFHDLGKYLFGFSIFWAYIGVSQYLLIWYANLPEETHFYMQREEAGWVWVSLLLPLLRFALPFALLLPRAAKRNSSYLQKVSLIVFLGAWVDLYWLVLPYFSPKVTFAFGDVGLFLGFLGLFAFVVRRFLAKHALVPQKDPYLGETLHHHVM